ncbi:MAG: GlxA family transcriptional regulator [Blastochloris viridis]|uniref:GlxA family transcriptional regulator n=1 Tax=Blastochloris viridis TaxID=1079 RepID=A0A6N4R006_BLAVI|nr:MAG: GlxA family transcriptional regulator [Blastochloris viridis]
MKSKNDKHTSNHVKAAHIAILVYPHALQSAIYGLTEQFMVADRIARQHNAHLPPVRVTHWNVSAGSSSVPLYDSHPYQPYSPPHTIIVPPSMQEDPLQGVDIMPIRTWLTHQHDQGAVLSSVCAGSFLLAESGLLNGRQATTHWNYASRMAQAYPTTRVEGDKLLVEDGDIITAGGMMAWVDLGLRLIHRIYGPTIMMGTARFMLVDPPGREQRYYSSFAPNFTHGDSAILKVQHWLQANGARHVTLPQMAAQAGLEPRTFLRRFYKATGLKPTEYTQHLRIGKAREALEFTRDSVEHIAWQSGYEDASAFRKIFHKITGLTPGDYRTRFAVTLANTAL